MPGGQRGWMPGAGPIHKFSFVLKKIYIFSKFSQFFRQNFRFVSQKNFRRPFLVIYKNFQNFLKTFLIRLPKFLTTFFLLIYLHFFLQN